MEQQSSIKKIIQNQKSSEVIRVFENYHFDFRNDLSKEDILVFTITLGIFDNAAIVFIKDEKKAKNIESELVELGFLVRTYEYNGIENIEKKLFDGFFSVPKVIKNFDRDYNDHINKITLSFPEENTTYNYKNVPYSRNSTDLPATNDLIEDIISDIKSKGPKLLLIEAPAGFGKTCTAYEIGKTVSARLGKINLFSELSRDRQAKIFNHIFYKELARTFPGVAHDLVMAEVKKGRIVVILDGFDELLKEKEEDVAAFEKSQAMLETIGEILDGDSKVILTTRRTAILQGDEFDDWISRNGSRFEFVRYSLKEPEIFSWLPRERIERLESSGIDIKNISNPVLLTFLMLINDEKFEAAAKNPDSIVSHYFTSMFNREMRRQELEVEPEEQSRVLAGLALDMMNHDYTRDTKENILKYFAEIEATTIEVARSKYPPDRRPSFDEMVDRLSNHALLDRSKSDDKIGFINDFVLGHFVALDLINSNPEDWVAESKFIEAAINSYSSRSRETKESIWEKLKPALRFFSIEQTVTLEMRLLGRASGKIKDAQFTNINFETKEFFIGDAITNSHFHECTFKHCKLNYDLIKNCIFISCAFYNCEFSSSANSNSFISCTHNGEPIEHESDELLRPPTGGNREQEIKQYILEKFWPIGKDLIAFAHRPLMIFYRSNSYSPSEINSVIEIMKRDGIIVGAQRKNWIGLDSSGSNYNLIRGILGR